MSRVEAPIAIDLATWPRAEHFRRFSATSPCTSSITSSITAEVDVTALTAALREPAGKTYPAQIWALAHVVNRRAEFRVTLSDGQPATWPVVHPSFTTFNPARETFSALWAPFDTHFLRLIKEVRVLFSNPDWVAP